MKDTSAPLWKLLDFVRQQEEALTHAAMGQAQRGALRRAYETIRAHGAKLADEAERADAVPFDGSRRALAISSIRGPVRFGGHGFIVDAQDERVAEVRGWGRLQYLDRAEERQDAIGELLAELINGAVIVPAKPDCEPDCEWCNGERVYGGNVCDACVPRSERGEV